MNTKQFDFISSKVRPTELQLLAKKILGIKRTKLELTNGLKYFIDPISNLGLTLQKEGHYEPKMTKCIADILEEGDCFIDLGANEGYFSVLASELCGDTGKIFAIEPQQRLWNIILINSSLNNKKNISILPYGIGAEKSDLVLNLYPSTNTGASSFSSNYNFKVSFSKLRKSLYGTQNVSVIKLDSLQETFPSDIKLIKIDIEGYEYEALQGAKEILNKKIIKNYLVEIHPVALKSLEQDEKDIDKLFEVSGYSKKSIDTNLNLYTL